MKDVANQQIKETQNFVDTITQGFEIGKDIDGMKSNFDKLLKAMDSLYQVKMRKS